MPILIVLFSTLGIVIQSGDAIPATPVTISPSPIPSLTPSPTITATRIPKDTDQWLQDMGLLPTEAPTPTPTLDPVVHIGTEAALDAVLPWGPAIEMFTEGRVSTELVLAVMAAESGGRSDAISPAGACGLMQVIWKPWYDISKSNLCSSNFANIRLGIHILVSAIDNAKANGYGLRYGIAYYNCSEISVHSDKCGSYGGLHYADRVLNFWLPRVRMRIADCAEQYGEDFWYNSNDVDRPGCNW